MTGTGFRAMLLLSAALPIVGCEKAAPQPRYQGTVVSHVDRYGSGTGSRSDLLSQEQSMSSGFDYGDPAKTDWNSSIRWRLVGHRAGKDVYRFEWEFVPKQGARTSQTKEVEFDGQKGVIVLSNDRQCISIEPGKLSLILEQSRPAGSQPSR